MYVCMCVSIVEEKKLQDKWKKIPHIGHMLIYLIMKYHSKWDMRNKQMRINYR